MSLRGTLKNKKTVALWKFDAPIGSPASCTDEVSGIVLASPSAGTSPVQVATSTGNGLNFNLTTNTLYMTTSAVPALQNLASGDWTVMAFYTTNNNTSEFETIASIHSPAGGNELLGVYVDPGADLVRVQWHDSGNTLRTCDLAYVIAANVQHHYAVRCKMVDSTHFNLSLVVDGVEVATGTNNFNHCAVSDQILAVSDGSAAGVDSVLKGVLDELALYNAYLSLYEIQVNAAGNPTPAVVSDHSIGIGAVQSYNEANHVLSARFNQQPYCSEAFDDASYTVAGRTVLKAEGDDTDPNRILLTLDALDPLNLPSTLTVNAAIPNVANTATTSTGAVIKVSDRRSAPKLISTPLVPDGPGSHGVANFSGQDTSIFIGTVGPVGAPPTVTFASPAVGSGIAQFGAVTINVAAPSTSQLKAVTITVIPGTSQAPETAFNGTQLNATGYSSGYTGGTVTFIPGGYRFTVTRAAGWLNGGPQFIVQAFDTDGQLVPASASWVYPPPPAPATITFVRAIDARALDVIFSAAVVESEALVASNYSISPSLAVKSVQKISDLEYILTTAKQTELANYTVTVSGIHDLNGNLVT